MSKGAYTYDYPRPMLTADAVVFAVQDEVLNVLLIQRGHEPWKGMWAIPGGFIEIDEELDTAALRELEEETSVTGVPLVQYHTFGGVDRDPRGRVITVAYLGVADPDRVDPKGGDDAAYAAWKPMIDLPPMAADHRDVVDGKTVQVLVKAKLAGQ